LYVQPSQAATESPNYDDFVNKTDQDALSKDPAANKVLLLSRASFFSSSYLDVIESLEISSSKSAGPRRPAAGATAVETGDAPTQHLRFSARRKIIQPGQNVIKKLNQRSWRKKFSEQLGCRRRRQPTSPKLLKNIPGNQ
jgi:hypothetical protein